MSGRILITGASVAGPTLAYWLRRYGREVVVLERAEAPRLGGQNIDIRGAAREVIRRMGLEGAVRAATTGEEGTQFIGQRGEVVAAFPAGTDDTGGATGEVEILRGDLAALLIDRTRDEPGVEYRFGDRIAAVTRNDDAVGVRFAGGGEETFDLVIAADGVGSSTRRLVFGDAVRFRDLQMEITYGTIPRAASDIPWWRWYNAPGRRSITMRPDSKGTTRATLSIVGDDLPAGADDHSREGRMAWLDRVFGDAGWETRRILDGFRDSDDLYSESLRQVRAPRWSKGRVGMVGDAAYCASPVSGMGTSLALVGAYVLAGELAAHVDHRDGFRGYERLMRPYVDQAQKLPPGTPKLANPQTRAGIAAFHVALRAVASPVFGALGERLPAPPADAIDLPDYGHLERA